MQLWAQPRSCWDAPVRPDTDSGTDRQSDGHPAPLSGTISVAGSSSVGPHIEGYIKPAFEALHKGIKVNVLISDSGTGIKTTEAGDSDIGMSSRTLKQEDGADLIVTVIAYDGIAVIVSNANSRWRTSRSSRSSTSSRARLPTGRTWAGSDAAIDVYQREAARNNADRLSMTWS